MPEHDEAERSTDELEVIDRRGRHVLGATEDHYVIVGAGGTLERFPLTEEGFQAAERRFAELRRLDRRERGVVPTALRIALLVGVGIWVLSGLVVVAFVVLQPQAPPFVAAYNIVYSLDGLGWRLALGSLFLMAGILLLRRERATRRPEADAPVDASPTAGWSAIDRVMAVILAVALLVWAISAVTTQLLFQEPTVPPAGTFAVIAPEARPHFIALFVQELAFRVWVAAAVLLAVRWAVRRGPH